MQITSWAIAWSQRWGRIYYLVYWEALFWGIQNIIIYLYSEMHFHFFHIFLYWPMLSKHCCHSWVPIWIKNWWMMIERCELTTCSESKSLYSFDVIFLSLPATVPLNMIMRHVMSLFIYLFIYSSTYLLIVYLFLTASFLHLTNINSWHF